MAGAIAAPNPQQTNPMRRRGMVMTPRYSRASILLKAATPRPDAFRFAEILSRRFGLPLPARCGMIATTTTNVAPWCVHREAFVRRTMSGLLASVMVIAAGAAMAQSKPPLKLGAILDMSGLYADITGAG